MVPYSRPLPRLRHTTADLGRLSPNSARLNAIYNQIISSHATTNAVNAAAAKHQQMQLQQQEHRQQPSSMPQASNSSIFGKSAIDVADLERYLLSSSSSSASTASSSSSSLMAVSATISPPPLSSGHSHNQNNHNNNNQNHPRQTSGSSLSQHGHLPPPPLNNRNYQEARYKTELCMHYREKNTCPHGARCLFAHGLPELRPYRGRHPKHKTQPCKSFHETGYCNYGYRCSYIHMESPRTINFIKSLNAEAQATRRNVRRAMMFGGGSSAGGAGDNGGTSSSSRSGLGRSGSADDKAAIGSLGSNGFIARGISGSSIGSGSSGHTEGSSGFLSSCSDRL